MSLLYEVEDSERGLAIELCGNSIELGSLADMSTADLAWFFLESLASDHRTEWSAPQLRAEMEISLDASASVRGGRHKVLSWQLSQLVADALGWLVSSGLIGPASEQSGSVGEWRVTTSGYEALRHGSLLQVEATKRLHVDLHPALQRTARGNFERGDYETAVFAAMKAVEVAVRQATGLPTEVLGAGLMAQAFRQNGPLEVKTEHATEGIAFLQLFSGAIGAFKNPASHRAVEYESPTEAADIIHLADLLLRIVDRERDRRST